MPSGASYVPARRDSTCRPSDTEQRKDAFFCGRTRASGIAITGRGDRGARLCFGDVTRVGAEANGFIAIDCDEDGQFDGWVAGEHLSSAFATRPAWIASAPHAAPSPATPPTADSASLLRVSAQTRERRPKSGRK